MTTLSDLEIVRLCAEAMDLCEDEQTTRSISYREEGHIWIRHEADAIGKMYHPLHDDAQAMALVKKLELSISGPPPSGLWDVYTRHSGAQVSACNADLLRAICECATRVQMGKEDK